jgi:prephenate dehydratase
LPSKIGFLGPRGTFSEEAILSSLDITEKDLVSYPSEVEVIQAVNNHKVTKGIVPLENSIEGSVNVCLDSLAFDVNLLIEKEIIIPIHHNLIVQKRTKLSDIDRVISHPQPNAQCRHWLDKNLPGVPVIASNSTAEAVKQASVDGKNIAAIGTRLAAKLYNMKILESNIEDFEENKTRFVLIGRQKPPASGKDKTSIACFIHKDKPGSLLQILQEFAFRNINLTKIQSRPTRKALGEYYFWIDLEGHIKDEIVSDAIKCLSCKLRAVKFLGSYPKGKI